MLALTRPALYTRQSYHSTDVIPIHAHHPAHNPTLCSLCQLPLAWGAQSRCAACGWKLCANCCNKRLAFLPDTTDDTEVRIGSVCDGCYNVAFYRGKELRRVRRRRRKRGEEEEIGEMDMLEGEAYEDDTSSSPTSPPHDPSDTEQPDTRMHDRLQRVGSFLTSVNVPQPRDTHRRVLPSGEVVYVSESQIQQPFLKNVTDNLSLPISLNRASTLQPTTGGGGSRASSASMQMLSAPGALTRPGSVGVDSRTKSNSADSTPSTSNSNRTRQSASPQGLGGKEKEKREERREGKEKERERRRVDEQTVAEVDEPEEEEEEEEEQPKIQSRKSRLSSADRLSDGGKGREKSNSKGKGKSRGSMEEEVQREEHEQEEEESKPTPSKRVHSKRHSGGSERE